MSRLPDVGFDDGTWGDILNDFLSQALQADGSLKPITDADVDNAAAISESKIANLSSDLAAKVDKTTTVNTQPLSADVSLTKTDIGLGNVDNTSDVDKPISTAQQAALTNEAQTRDDADSDLEDSISAIESGEVWDGPDNGRLGRISGVPTWVADSDSSLPDPTTGTYKDLLRVNSTEDAYELITPEPVTIWQGHTFAVQGEIKVPSGDTDFIPPFFIAAAPTQTVKLIKCRHRINSGTSATAKLQINGSDATGFTGISVTTSAGETDPTDITLDDGDRIGLVVTAVSGSPTSLSFTIVLEIA